MRKTTNRSNRRGVSTAELVLISALVVMGVVAGANYIGGSVTGAFQAMSDGLANATSGDSPGNEIPKEDSRRRRGR